MPTDAKPFTVGELSLLAARVEGVHVRAVYPNECRLLAALRERDATIAELRALLKDAMWAADHPLESRGIV